MRRFGVTTLTLFVALLALLVGSISAARTAADPIVGKWKITRGGRGTFTIAPRAGTLAITATGGVTLGCVTALRGDFVGFVDLPRNTRLKKGHYNGNFGTAGQGCYYNVALTLVAKTLTGKVSYSEADQVGGPFTFAKVK